MHLGVPPPLHPISEHSAPHRLGRVHSLSIVSKQTKNSNSVGRGPLILCSTEKKSIEVIKNLNDEISDPHIIQFYDLIALTHIQCYK